MENIRNNLPNKRKCIDVGGLNEPPTNNMIFSAIKISIELELCKPPKTHKMKLDLNQFSNY